MHSTFVEIFFGLGANPHVTHGHPFVTIPPPTHTEWSAHKLDFFCQTIAKEADILNTPTKIAELDLVVYKGLQKLG